jgi:hypothetical protein
MRALELMNDRQREAEAFRLARLAHEDDRGARNGSRPLISRVATALASWSGRRGAEDSLSSDGSASFPAHADQLELISHRS